VTIGDTFERSEIKSSAIFLEMDVSLLPAVATKDHGPARTHPNLWEAGLLPRMAVAQVRVSDVRIFPISECSQAPVATTNRWPSKTRPNFWEAGPATLRMGIAKIQASDVRIFFSGRNLRASDIVTPKIV